MWKTGGKGYRDGIGFSGDIGPKRIANAPFQMVHHGDEWVRRNGLGFGREDEVSSVTCEVSS